MLSLIFKLSTKDILEVRVMTTNRLSLEQVQHSISTLVYHNQLHKLDGAVIPLANGKEYRLKVEDNKHVKVLRQAEFHQQKISTAKHVMHLLSDKFGFSHTAKLTKSFNDPNVKYIFNKLDEHCAKLVKPSPLGVSFHLLKVRAAPKLRATHTALHSKTHIQKTSRKVNFNEIAKAHGPKKYAADTAKLLDRVFKAQRSGKLMRSFDLKFA